MSNANKTTKTAKPKSDLSWVQAKRLAGIAAAMLSLAIILLVQAYRVEHRAATELVAVPQMPIALKQQISMGAVDVTLRSVSFESGQQPFIAPTGKKYAVTELTIKNKSDKPIQVLPSSDIYMKDAAGDVAYLSPYNLSEPLRAGELSPGEQIKGQLSFVVRADVDYKLYIDSVWSGGVLPFATR